MRTRTRLCLLPDCTVEDAEAQPPWGALGGCSSALSVFPRYPEESQHPWFQTCAKPRVFAAHRGPCVVSLYRKCYKLRAKCRHPDRHPGWKETTSTSVRSPAELSLPRKTLHFFRDRKRQPRGTFCSRLRLAGWLAVQRRESHHREVVLGLGSKPEG